MTNVGPQFKLPSNQTTYSFLTSGNGAGYANFGKIGLADSYSNIDLTNYRLDVINGKIRFQIPSADNASDKNFIVGASGKRYLAFGGAGIQAYDASNVASSLYLNYNGGSLEIGSSTNPLTSGNFYGSYDFKSQNGFTYSGIGAASDNTERNVWFSYNGILGRPVYDNDFKYNPSTNSLHIIHAAGKDPGEVRVTYSTTVDMGLGIGSANANHGLYDFKASKWMIVSDASGNVTVNGNAATATKLAASKNINGTAFDGSANITTANWGTARTITIGETGKSVNGSADVSWTKTEILGSGDTGQFLRGDHTWSNELVSTNTTDTEGNILRLRTTATIASGYQYGINHLVPNLAGSSNSNTIMLTGVANSAGNQGYLGFHYVGDANNENWVSLGIYGKDHLIKAFYTGYIATSGTTQFSNTTSWNDGTAIIGADGTDKAIVGYCNSSTNGVVFGAHASSCTAWAPVNLSGTQINFRNSETLVGKFLNGCLSLFPTPGSYQEGIRIHSASNNWCHITFCGADNTGDSGISTNSWFVGNNNGNFYITKSSSTGGSVSIRNISDNWNILGKVTIGNTTQGQCLELYSDGEGSNIFMRCAGSNGAASNIGYQLDTYQNNLRLYRTTNGGSAATAIITLMDGNGYSTFVRAYGAVWNDYAEMREVQKEIEPGRCVHEVGDDTMVLSTARLQRGCKIISDTFGFNIGETETAKTPIAVSGRALVYLTEGREVARSHIGWPVCSGPDGTVSIMTEEEEEKYPSRIVGTISSVPDYEEWGTGKVKVNGRIWIYVR